ncbi:MAG: bestrophin family ion channel, partial [Flavobacteriaceae bacterium]
MLVSKGIGIVKIVKWSWHHIVWLLAYMGLVAYGYRMEWLAIDIPWLPISVIGTAVAFYVGFKNNQSYDRMWEARKIWGGIVNDSRSWGMMVDGFVTNLFAGKNVPDHELHQIKK